VFAVELPATQNRQLLASCALQALRVEIDRHLLAKKLPDSVLNKVIYRGDILQVGGASITFYQHESLTPEQVLDRIVEHYKAWTVNRPGGRR
jgi:hypothetical protein